MYSRGIDSRIKLSICFSLVAVAAFALQYAPVPNGPWVDIYGSFPLFWGLLAIASAFLLWTISKPDRIVDLSVLIAVPLIIVLVTLPTLKWGPPYGIRDPWVHLSYINTHTFSGENPYPLMHSLLSIIVSVTEISAIEALKRIPILAVLLGSGLVAITVRIIAGRRWQFAFLGVVPCVFLWLIARPYTVGPLFVLMAWWLMIKELNVVSHTILLVILLIGAVAWHPVAMILINVVFINLWLVKSIPFNTLPLDLEYQFLTIRERRLFIATLLSGLIFTFYMVYTTLVVEGITTRAFAESASSGSNSVGGANSGGHSVAVDIPSKVAETLSRGRFVLGLVIIGTFAIVKSAYNRNAHYLSIVSVISGGFIGIAFLGLTLFPSIPFGLRRAIILVTLLLVPAASVGIREIPRLSMSTVVVALLLVAGLSVAHIPVQYSSTQSDVSSVSWYIDYQENDPVVGSGNTLYIAEAVYGQSSANDLHTGKPFQYQTARRPEEFPWRVAGEPNGTYYTIGAPDRIKASKSPTVDGELRLFSETTSRVYDNGNVWVHRA